MQNEALASRLGWAVYEYDFAKHGGAVSSISITPKLIPTGGVILGGMVHVKTALVGSGASVAFYAVNAGDILETTAITSLTLNALLDVVPVYTAATAIRCTAHTQLTMVISAAALTAGKIAVGLAWGSTD